MFNFIQLTYFLRINILKTMKYPLKCSYTNSNVNIGIGSICCTS